MKRFISIILVFSLICLLPANAFASESTNTEIATETFSYMNEHDDTVSIVTERCTGYATTKVYINNILSQESVASLENDTVTTHIYDINGMITSTSDQTISNIHSISNVEYISNNTEIDIQPIVPELQVNSSVITPVGPGDGGSSTPDRNVMDEPVDNTGLSFSHTLGGKNYYYLGNGTDSFAPSVTAYVYRACDITYDGETHTWTWGAGTTISAIWSVLSLFLPTGFYGSLVGLFVFTISLTLDYAQSLKLATYTIDHYYTVLVGGGIYLTPERNRTYWRMDNVTTGVTKWELKSFNFGFSMSNQEMIRLAVSNYCEDH